jgi:hypothetical protein
MGEINTMADKLNIPACPYVNRSMTRRLLGMTIIASMIVAIHLT